MRVQPVGEKLVVQPLKSERVTEGGIVIPESEAEKYDIAAVKAKVIAIGPLAFEAEKQHEKSFGVQISAIPRVGSTVAMAKYAGYEIKVDKDTLRVVTDQDITAILEDENE